ncbi:hypothetical protein DPMN_018892 [Dreissena polymorpha]|uniref:Uncharacterized protein n=1 Tax=Dreissena polymorpha TaxID=45954 RepID=A0A9D4S8R6_DREPO|nr:hypothetical protein DPMN_018892 [Dreissena polymorpha]
MSIHKELSQQLASNTVDVLETDWSVSERCSVGIENKWNFSQTLDIYLPVSCPCGSFTLHKLADMRRTGVGKPRPLLDQEKLDLFRGPD